MRLRAKEARCIDCCFRSLPKQSGFVEIFFSLFPMRAYARNPTKASTPARKLARGSENGTEKDMFPSGFLSEPLILEAYVICRALSAVLPLSIFLFFMTHFAE
jgi:hypothetical protein